MKRVFQEDLLLYESLRVSVCSIMCQPERTWSRSAEQPGRKGRSREEVLPGQTPAWTSGGYVWLLLPIPAPTVKGHCSVHSERLWWAVLRKGTPLSLILCGCVCVYTWVGWGWVGCIFGPNSEDLTVLPGETCRIPLIWGCVYVNNWCVNVCVATGLPTPWACFYKRERI